MPEERSTINGQSQVKNGEPLPQYEWLNGDELNNRFKALILDGDVERGAWKDLVVNLMMRVQDKRAGAAGNSSRAHWFERGSAGASAAVSAVTAAALLGTLSGGLSKAIGATAAVVGVVSAAIVAAKPGSSFATDTFKKPSTSSCTGSCTRLLLPTSPA
jgi:hypothetical protein